MADIVPVGDDRPLPEITVLLATRGRATTIVRTLESLAAQTLAADRFEVLVIVNDAVDNTLDVARGFAAPDSGLALRVLTCSATASPTPGTSGSPPPGVHT